MGIYIPIVPFPYKPEACAERVSSFSKLQTESLKVGDRLNYARQRTSLLKNELGAMGPPLQRQIVVLERQRLAVQRLEEKQQKLQSQNALVRADLYRTGIQLYLELDYADG